jgi:8-oxoguanine deaminase
MTTTLFKNALALATMDEQRREFRNASILIENNRIKAVGPSVNLPQTADEVIDATCIKASPAPCQQHRM